MAISLLDTVLNEVRASVPDAPGNILYDAVIKAAREFCRRTLAWRVRSSISTVAGTPNYVAYPTAVGIVADFFAPKLDTDTKLTKLTPNQVDELDPELLTKRDTPSYAFLNGTQNEISLAAVPNAVYTFAYQAALIPPVNATTLDDDLWDRHGDAIISGTLHRVLRMPGKSWSDAQMAEYHRGLFENAIPTAKSRAADGNMNGVPRKVKYGGL